MVLSWLLEVTFGGPKFWVTDQELVIERPKDWYELWYLVKKELCERPIMCKAHRK